MNFAKIMYYFCPGKNKIEILKKYGLKKSNIIVI